MNWACTEQNILVHGGGTGRPNQAKDGYGRPCRGGSSTNAPRARSSQQSCQEDRLFTVSGRKGVPLSYRMGPVVGRGSATSYLSCFFLIRAFLLLAQHKSWESVLRCARGRLRVVVCVCPPCKNHSNPKAKSATVPSPCGQCRVTMRAIFS